MTQNLNKKIFIFKNGDAKSAVAYNVNVNNFNTLLSNLSKQLDGKRVEHLYSANTGLKISTVQDIRNNEQYVVTGSERFQEVEYKAEKVTELTSQRNPSLLAQQNILEMPFSKNNIRIHVFKNGNDRKPAKKFVFSADDFSNETAWSKTSHYLGVSLNIFSDVQNLYTLKGVKVAPEEVQNGEHYVAVGYNEKFKQALYMKDHDTEHIKEPDKGSITS